jgi:DNA adenine methylase
MQPLFGYPGGKSRAVKKIVETLDLDLSKYRQVVEPFCGGAAFTLGTLPQGGEGWLNDMDFDLMALWMSIVHFPDALCDAVTSAKIEAEDFYRLREKLLKPRKQVTRKDAVVRCALDKLIIHKISFSNMGEMSGSPVGGKNQTGAWKFDCRWKPDLICKRIKDASELLEGVCLTNWDYQTVFRWLRKDDFVFIDPPYVDAGAKCYKHSFTMANHVALAKAVKSLRCEWAITYDYHPSIVEMYSWADVYDLEFKYFMSSAYRSGETMKVGKELLITNRS